MTSEHPNVALLKRLDFRKMEGAADLFAEDIVWHFFNSRLPDVHGDYVGLSGLQSFFEKLGAATAGTFETEPISVSPIGDELVVTHNRNRLTHQGVPVETDVVLVWRIVDGRIAEVWDIPSIHAVKIGSPLSG
jgi:ketosteroid isomerase-like protein